MSRTDRRSFLRAGVGSLLLTPLAALLAGCSHRGDWPEGMAAIKWDRDTCARCSMVISDYRFACEVRGGPQDTAFHFDDPGCMVIFMHDKAQTYPWLADPALRMWVADYGSESRAAMHWLDPRAVRYLTHTSPMGYNLAAVSAAADGVDFSEMRRRALARGK